MVGGARIAGLVVGMAFALGSGAAEAHPGADEQLEAVESDLAAHPDRTDLLLKRAEVHRRAGHTEEALADYARLQALADPPAGLFLGRGILHLDLDRPEDAERDLATFLRLRPEEARGLLAWARLRDRTGPRIEAAAAWRAALSLLDRPEPEHYLAASAAFEAAGQPDDAVSALDRGIEQLGAVQILTLEAVAVLVRSDRGVEALPRLRAAAEAASQPAPIWVRHAQLLTDLARPQEARASWSEAEAALLRLPVKRRRSPRVRELYALVRAALDPAPSVR